MRIIISFFFLIPIFCLGQTLNIKDTIIGNEKYEGIKYLENGLVEVGEIKKDMESGLWKIYDLKGDVIYQGKYKNGLKEGLWIHPNGGGCGITYKKGIITSKGTYVKYL